MASIHHAKNPISVGATFHHLIQLYPSKGNTVNFGQATRLAIYKIQRAYRVSLKLRIHLRTFCSRTSLRTRCSYN